MLWCLQYYELELALIEIAFVFIIWQITYKYIASTTG